MCLGVHCFSGEIEPLSEVRAFFLQYKLSATSAHGSESEDDDDTEQGAVECNTIRRERFGRPVTMPLITMTPSRKALKRTRKEMVSGMSACAPGPHAFLTAVCMDLPFSEKWRREIQEHLELVGGREVWRYTIVVFYSSAGWTPDQYIERESETLHWLLEKCGNRYVEMVEESSWVEVLKKIEEVVALNGGRHFEADESGGPVDGVVEPEHWRREVEQLVDRIKEQELMRSMDTPPASEYHDRVGGHIFPQNI